MGELVSADKAGRGAAGRPSVGRLVNGKTVFLGAALAAALAFFIWTSTQGAVVYFHTVGELRAMGSEAIGRLVRALSPSPGAWTELGGQRLRVLGVEPAAAARAGGAASPGTAIDDALTIACGEGALRLTRLQRGGRSALDAPAFLRGLPVPAGTMLGR